MLWDPIRNLWVKPIPEEIVRQKWIRTMIQELGYPQSLLAVEKDLSSMPLWKGGIDPNRRLDLLCFTPGKEGLIPLLLAECKAGPITKAAERQVVGYNEAVGAPFLCLMNQKDARTLWFEKGQSAFVPFLPTYSQLLEKI